MRRSLLALVWLIAASGIALLGLAIYEVKRTPPIQPKPAVIDRVQWTPGNGYVETRYE